MQKIIKTSIIWIIFMLGCCGCQKKEQPIQELEEIGSEKSETSKKEETKEKKSIYVYVCGAVMQAGVYELQQDSRVYEAIQKAGGFAENADISEINQAALLQDEEQIYVPAAGEVDHSLKKRAKQVMRVGSQSEYRHKRRIDDTCRDWRIQSGQYYKISGRTWEIPIHRGY